MIVVLVVWWCWCCACAGDGDGDDDVVFPPGASQTALPTSVCRGALAGCRTGSGCGTERLGSPQSRAAQGVVFCGLVGDVVMASADMLRL